MKSPQNQKHKGEALMDILDELHLESNNKIKINFNGGDLSSDAGMIPVNEFARKIGFDKLIQSKFKTNDSASFDIWVCLIVKNVKFQRYLTA
jgi:hypothetical protein